MVAEVKRSTCLRKIYDINMHFVFTVSEIFHSWLREQKSQNTA